MCHSNLSERVFRVPGLKTNFTTVTGPQGTERSCRSIELAMFCCYPLVLLRQLFTTSSVTTGKMVCTWRVAPKSRDPRIDNERFRNETSFRTKYLPYITSYECDTYVCICKLLFLMYDDDDDDDHDDASLFCGPDVAVYHGSRCCRVKQASSPRIKDCSWIQYTINNNKLRDFRKRIYGFKKKSYLIGARFLDVQLIFEAVLVVFRHSKKLRVFWCARQLFTFEKDGSTNLY